MVMKPGVLPAKRARKERMKEARVKTMEMTAMILILTMYLLNVPLQ